jgi:hypothetical protein
MIPKRAGENQLIHRPIRESGFILGGCRGGRCPYAETAPMSIDPAGGVALENSDLEGR